MKRESNKLKSQLDKELRQIKFNKQEEVLNRTHPVSFRQKLKALWNKEIEIPVVPVGATLLLLLFSWGILEVDKGQQISTAEPRQLVEVAGNTYWKDELEKVVAVYED